MECLGRPLTKVYPLEHLHGCSGTCGEHVMRTKKRMKLQEAANGGERCKGATKRVMPCNLPQCDDERIPDDFVFPDDLEIGSQIYTFVPEDI